MLLLIDIVNEQIPIHLKSSNFDSKIAKKNAKFSPIVVENQI